MNSLRKLASYVSSWNRKRKWESFNTLIDINKSTKILDIGYENKEFSNNSNFLEKNHPYLSNITALGIEEYDEFSKKYPEVKVVKYDGKYFPFDNNEFDVCWSNAVIEHVGDFERQLIFLNEVIRVSKICYITTPNKFFPIETHTLLPFLHYLPKKLFDKILIKIGQEYFAGDNLNLLSLGNIHELLTKLNVKSYKILQNKFCFMTMDFVVIVNP